jgi:MOSC domain-containing protein YiiM/GNAT superfamily N-acetyltransferase
VSAQIAAGRVLQVNVSDGGVPKLPIERGWVNRLGVDGDAHREATVHGGPHRAVCLLGIEAIERMRAEGHPIFAGSSGENLTTSGMDWSLLPIGAIVQIGDQLELELSDSTTPCSTQVGNFSDGNFNRMLIDKYPADSRMYARVLREGSVAPGDAISVAAPAAGSAAADELLLKRLDRAETKSTVAAWRSARDAGFQVETVEDGEIALATSHQLPGAEFNQAVGLARLPNMLPLATTFFDRHGTPGWLRLSDQPWPDAVSDYELGFYGAAPDEVTDCPPPDGVTIREIGAEEVELFNAFAGNVGDADETTSRLWPEVFRRLAAQHRRRLFVAEYQGTPIARASLSISARTGWLRSMLVAPEFRGRGLQRALISARSEAAAQSGCDLVGAAAEPSWISAQNLEACGLRRLATRQHYVYQPRGVAP